MSTKTARSQRGKKGPVSSKKIAPPQKMAAPPRRRMARRRRGLGPGIIAMIVGVAIIALGVIFFLNNQGGSTVLLYFQEGLTCQPCWDQLKDIQSNISQFHALGIDQVVSITTDPVNAVQQKVTDAGITIPVLSDTQLMASRTYSANSYGMMGDSRDGHTFIVVGPDGFIKWRADYGGAPKYTMYVPVPNLIADIRQGLKGGSS